MRTTPVLAEPVRGSVWVRFLVGWGVLWAVLAGLSEIDATGRLGLLILAAVVATAMVVEILLFRTPFSEAVAALGLGRPTLRPLVLAVIVAGLVQLVYPLTTALTGVQPKLVDGWPLLLVGVFAYHGLAEELVWRGFAFRRLQVARSFRSAVLWSMLLMAVTHVPIIFRSGAVVGFGALLVAAVTSIPFAYLYNTGRATIWAPAILHTGIDSFKLVVIPPEATLTFSLLLITVSLFVPLLALAVPRRILLGGEES